MFQESVRGHRWKPRSTSLPFNGMVVGVTHRICEGIFCWVLCSTPPVIRELCLALIWHLLWPFDSFSLLTWVSFLFLNRCVCLISLSTQPPTHQTHTRTYSSPLLPCTFIVNYEENRRWAWARTEVGRICGHLIWGLLPWTSCQLYL